MEPVHQRTLSTTPHQSHRFPAPDHRHRSQPPRHPRRRPPAHPGLQRIAANPALPMLQTRRPQRHPAHHPRALPADPGRLRPAQSRPATHAELESPSLTSSEEFVLTFYVRTIKHQLMPSSNTEDNHEQVF